MFFEESDRYYTTKIMASSFLLVFFLGIVVTGTTSGCITRFIIVAVTGTWLLACIGDDGGLVLGSTSRSTQVTVLFC